MSRIQVLDCTLRDGGYCNDWSFGFENINRIVESLNQACIEIVECGFLTEKELYRCDRTKFTDINQIKPFLSCEKNAHSHVVMINYGEYDVRRLPVCDRGYINGVRLAFHKKDVKEALQECKIIKEKGYDVYLQPMVSLNYSDEEFIKLIHHTNEIVPYALYIVDSFGMMKQKDLTRLFYLVENNLLSEINVGFHSHNNLQLAYSNAQYLAALPSVHNIIIDSSVYGMGRGAGNLNTELFIAYLNENYSQKYSLEPILNIIDEILNGFYLRKPWGYSLSNYLSAVYHCHPNYATFLNDKNTLTIKEMNQIFAQMDSNKKVSYDKKYIEQLYYSYMKSGTDVEEGNLEEVKNKLMKHPVVLIGMGKSSITEQNSIKKFIQEKSAIVFTINNTCDYWREDYVFLSNLRRYRGIDKKVLDRCIVTSNIKEKEAYIKVEYNTLINNIDYVQDNAGLMAITFLQKQGVSEIYLAGFDGYTHNDYENYGDESLAMVTKDDILDKMNAGMRIFLNDISKQLKIHFLTTPKMIKIEEENGEN